MKLSVQKEQIIEGLQKAADILPARAGGAYLRSIWLKAENGELSIMSTDASIEFKGIYPAEVEEPGMAGVPGKALVDLIRRLPAGKIKFSLNNETDKFLVEQGRRSYQLPANGPEWFQEFSPFPAGEPVVWSGDMLQQILDKVAFCISDDESRDAMACFYLKPVDKDGKIEACGLNGHQFAMFTLIEPELAARIGSEGLLIQRKFLTPLKKWLPVDDIELNITEKNLYLKKVDGSEMLTVPRTHRDYPDYNVFLSRFNEKDLSRLKIGREECSESLGRIHVFNTQMDSGVYMDLSPHEIKLSAAGADIGSGQECLEVEYQGALSRIAFPTKNLIEIFSHFSSADLEMRFTGEEGPCGITGKEDGEYLVVIMPIRISQDLYYTEEDN